MKTKWSKFEILVTGFSIVMIPQAARMAAGFFSGRYVIPILFLVPLISTAILVYFLKRRGKQVWFATAFVIALLILLGLAAKYHVKVTRLVKLVTGHFNLESTGFSIMIGLLICGGALVGIGAGALLSGNKGSKSREI